jgi:hypothetical protein
MAMVIGGRVMMRYDKRSWVEGLLSCMVGVVLLVEWCNFHPDDFGALGGGIRHSLRGMSASDGAFPLSLAALILASFVFILFLLFHRLQERPEKGSVRSFFGPMSRVRRPKRLH